ncbi:hypothetical protein GBAR_LOCUS1946, partial [Geodia barretti]
MTWETADGRELSRSPNSNSILYSAPVEATLEMICYAYTVHTSVQFLQFFVLIAQGTVIGFSSTTYAGTETSGIVSVCVEVFNPSSGGATEKFDVTLLSAEELSDGEQKVQCSTFEFERGMSAKCHECGIIDDDVCSAKENVTEYELILSVPPGDRLGVDSSRTTTNITIDDSRETECYVRVGYESSSYTISEPSGREEICVTSRSPGIDEMFTINIATHTSPNSVDLFQQTTDSLTFDGTSHTQCYEVTFNFDVENICEHFDCRGIQLESTLTTADESARVHINTSTAVVIIKLPENCTCTNEPHTLSNSNDNNFKTVTAIISSLVVVIVILAVVVLGMLCYRKSKKKDRFLPRDYQRAAVEGVSFAKNSIDPRHKGLIYCILGTQSLY